MPWTDFGTDQQPDSAEGSKFSKIDPADSRQIRSIQKGEAPPPLNTVAAHFYTESTVARSLANYQVQVVFR